MNNRRLALAGTGTALVLVLGALAQRQPAAAQPVATAIAPILRARAIELVDARGQARAQLSVEPNGEAVFRMRDAEGTIRVKLGASKDGSGLVLLDERTEPGLHVLAKREGTTLMLQRGKQQRVIKP